MENYTILHLHTDLSTATTNIDSVTKSEDYIKKASELDMKAIAFTEHGNILNWAKKKEVCEKYGLKYIHGIEAYLTETLDKKVRDNYHCCLYAKNYEGVKELNKLISKSFNRMDNHFYYTPRITLDELEQTSNNIIVTSACLGGVFGKANKYIQDRYLKFFIRNKDRCYLEIQHHLDEKQIKLNKKLLKLAKENDLNLTVGTDTHALNEIHAKGRKILQQAKKINFGDEDNWDITFKTYDELIDMYKKQNAIPMNEVLKALENTNKIADSIETFEINREYKYPKLWDNPEELLKEKINKGIKEKGLNKLDNFKTEYLPRIKEELKTYKHNKAIDFLLLDEDIKSYARKNNRLPGYSRGSVSGSLVAYIIGLTDMDSIKHKLNFQRFMNVERVSLADIDTDWDKNDRKFIKEYIYNKKGLYCADIITFNTVALKGSIRDVGRALEISLNEVNEICDNIENKEKEYRELYPQLFEYVDIINGTVVSVGTHPCGLVCSPKPLDENMGLMSLSTCDYPVTMLNMKEIDSQNYVKLDLLALDNITLINKTCELLGIKRLNPNNVPDDENVWKSIRDDTLGIFQWEGTGENYIKDLFSDKTIANVKKYNPNFKYIDLFSVGNGAIRPAGASYREQLAKGIFKDNGHKALNDFLSPTLGYCIEENQKVSTINGLKSIKDINVGDVVYTKEGTSKVTYKVNNGKKNIIKIKLKDGNELLCTKDHRIFTHRGWVKAKDLNDKDVVATRVGNDNINIYNKNILKIIGWLLGDGILTTNNNVGFVNQDIDVINEFKKCVESEFNNLTCSIKNPGSRVNHIPLYYLNVKYKQHSKKLSPLTKYLQDIGFKYKGGGGVHAIHKFIPSFIFSLNNECLLNLIGAYTDTDSCLKNGDKIILSYKTASLSLAKDLKEIFRLLSYRANISKCDNAYLITIKEAKKVLLKLYDHSYKIRKTFKKEDLKITRKSLKSVISRNYIRSMVGDEIALDISKHYNINLYSKSKFMSMENVKVINDIYPGILDKELFNDNICWCEIKDIVDLKTKSNVYDIEIENHHNFVCQGIIVHNCVYQEQIIEFLNRFCGYTMGEADIVRRGFAKKSGTEQYIPKIKEGFTKTMKGEYNLSEEESEKIIVDFLKVIHDASDYLFSLNHSQSYSYIGYICGYLRYYYPLEFLTTMFNVYESDLDKTKKIVNYAKKHNIEIKNPKFRFSRSEYFLDRESNSIYKGIKSIKNLNKNAGELLYSLKDNNYNSFIELLVDIGKKINSKQMTILISLDFFSEFGGVQKLLKVYEFYQTFYGKKQLSKDKYPSLNKIFSKYAERETEKKYIFIDTLPMLIAIEKHIKDNGTDTIKLIKTYFEFCGNCNIIDKSMGNKCIITDINTKYTPRITLYGIGNGKLKDVKIYKKNFKQDPLEIGDVISIKGYQIKNKKKKEGDKWIELEDKEMILTKYEKFTK